MAEATDRPPDREEVPSRAAAAQAEERVSAWPERDAVPGGELGAMPPTGSVSYRPLSLLALAAFALSLVYALTVLVGGAVALLNHTPCLMPSWTFLFPLAVLLLCWMARNRIRDAEGTLSGLTFTVWGIRLTVVIGLSYLAYFGFTFFAVRLQAQDYANEFFKQLKQGHSERAFLLSTSNPSQEDDAKLRDMLEVRFNNPTGPGAAAGPFSQFRQSQFVRSIEMGGEETRIESKGVLDWGYAKGGYRVVMKYHIATPWAEFDMSVDTFGRDSKPGEPKGRQWEVLLQKADTGVLPQSIKLTPRGDDFMKKAEAARHFALSWQEKIARRQWDDVYLDTLKPAERNRLRKGRKAADVLPTTPLAGLAPLGLCDEACRDFLAGRQAFAEGKLMHLDDKKTWISKIERPAILERLRQTFAFASHGRPTFLIRSHPGQMPLARSHGGQLNILFDLQLTYPDEKTVAPKYVAEGYLIVSAEEGEGANAASAWRVESIEVSSARTAPKMPDRAGRPGG